MPKERKPTSMARFIFSGFGSVIVLKHYGVQDCECVTGEVSGILLAPGKLKMRGLIVILEVRAIRAEDIEDE